VAVAKAKTRVVIEDPVMLELSAREAQAVATLCGMGMIHFSDDGKAMLKANGVLGSDDRHSVWGALTDAGLQVEWPD
jgi:hypothetical protein